MHDVRGNEVRDTVGSSSPVTVSPFHPFSSPPDRLEDLVLNVLAQTRKSAKGVEKALQKDIICVESCIPGHHSCKCKGR